ncbi:MAG TPA: hypothetical protein VFW59_01570 [Gallionella sp.]|nr:hypothetical protein [Gallionella sp.]
MVINSATVSASYSPASVSEVTRTNAQPSVDKVQAAQAQQPSTVVKLSTQGQTLSLSDRPGSTGESTESRVKEGGETSSVQFQEGEGRAAAPAPQAAPAAASPAIAAYAQVAAQ